MTAREVEGMKWDYQTAVLTGGFMGRHKEELKRSDLDRQLDEFGAQGFELCWVLMDQALQREKDGHVLIFKRPLEDALAANQPRVCGECGGQVRPGAQFCGSCGVQVG